MPAQNTKVWIECAGLSTCAAWPATQRKYVTGLSPGFITTADTFPSGFTNAVDSSALRLGELTMRRAPGRTNYEKCPMYWSELV